MKGTAMSSITSTLPLGALRHLPGTPWLRRALGVDAAFSGVAGAAMLAGQTLLAPVLGLPPGLLAGAGGVALAWAALLGLMVRRASLPRALLWAVVLGNAAWVAASVALLVFSWVQPTVLGTTFLVAQALAVAVFMELQWWAMRRAGSRP
jgi:hypothetical protein